MQAKNNAFEEKSQAGFRGGISPSGNDAPVVCREHDRDRFRGGISPPGNPLVLSDAWLDFLSRWRWEWIAHLTFREDVHPETADKTFRLWIHRLNRELWGKRYYRHGRGVIWVRGLERQRRGVIHFHSLLANVGDARRLSWMDEWDKLAGFARIWPVASQREAVAYITKYVTKGGEVDLGGPLG